MITEILPTISENELKCLIENIRKEYGYDFSDYSEASLKRRVIRLMTNNAMTSVAVLNERIITDTSYLNSFINEITVNVTEMFRDPSFYRVLLEEVFPSLTHLPLIRVWHAGCSSGEEVYSLAILLKEAGLLEKSLLYATDINLEVLQNAATGKFPLTSMNEYVDNYKQSGGKYSLEEYYEILNETAVFNNELRKRMVFSHHNLTIDQSFNEFNLILCRNVLIYFNRNLQGKVFNLFADSLALNGYLALGTKETLEFSEQASAFNCINKKNKIWKIKK